MASLVLGRSAARGLVTLAVAALAAVAPAPGGEEPGRRPAWTGSRIKGSPEPPPPYTVESAFPKLTFDRPVVLTSPPGPAGDRLFVAEVGGKVHSFPNRPDVARTDLALDLAQGRGPGVQLYGMAFHPRFTQNHEVYLCYITEGGKPDGTRVSRFLLKGADPPCVDPASERVLLTFLSGGHNAGCLGFGPDGFLYIATGDAADPSPPDPFRTGQDLSDLLSSILRIDVDGAESGRPYRVPPDNPFSHRAGARPEIWAYGFRNPWRFSFDREGGDLWVGDVGWELWEMIDRVERGGNYGWSLVEGHQPVRRDITPGPTPVLPPVVEHPHSEAASITGGYVYRGKRLPELVGTYIYGDFQSGKVWGLRLDARKTLTWKGELADTPVRIVSFGEDREGELYFLDFERTNQVYRLVPNPTPLGGDGFPRLLSATGLFASTREAAPAPGVVPYAIQAELWADGARGDRLVALPGEGRIAVDAEGRWGVPEGTVLARTVTVDLVAGDPSTRRRVETQILHHEDGSWRPYTYAWDEAQGDATLVGPEGANRSYTIRDQAVPGGAWTFDYRISARSECLLCHNPWVERQTTVFGRQTASPLAFHAGQLDRPRAGSQGGQLDHLQRLGLFASAPAPRADRPPRRVDPYDESADLDRRARSYLDVNCAHCHQNGAGGTATLFLPMALPLSQTRTVEARPMQGAFGIAEGRILAPGDPDGSVLLYRMSKLGGGRMPRVGSRRVDDRAVRLIGEWIAGMPSRGRHAELAAAESLTKTPEARRAQAIAGLLGSTRGGMALLRQVDRGSLPDPVRALVVAQGRTSPVPEVRDLFERFVPDAERVRTLGDPIDPGAVLALRGDLERGRATFRSATSAQCRNCHRAEGVGQAIGPDLDRLGAKYPRAELLREILQPSRSVEPPYVAYLVETRDGGLHSGLMVERTDRAVLLRDAGGQTIRISPDQVEQVAPQGKSLMPEGLLRDLTAQQAADLLDYLASLK